MKYMKFAMEVFYPWQKGCRRVKDSFQLWCSLMRRIEGACTTTKEQEGFNWSNSSSVAEYNSGFGF